MRLLTILALLSICGSVSAQSTQFIATETKVLQFVQKSQWDEVLILAPDLITEEPGRGEGYYYTALAFLKLEDIEKAKEYLVTADSLATQPLKVKIAELKAELNRQETIKTATNKVNQAGNKKQAADYKKLWELDKSNLENALSAVELYLEKEEYVAALEILNDPAVIKEPEARKLIEVINSKPKMIRLNGYNAAMKQADNSFSNGDYDAAITKYTEALRFYPNDNKATNAKTAALDEKGWQMARRTNTDESYIKYLNDFRYGKYRNEADDILQRAYLKWAREKATENNFESAVEYYKRYQSRYPRGPQINEVNNELCNLYFAEGKKYEGKKTVSEISKSIELFTIAKACGHPSVNQSRISSLESKRKRWSRPDHGFFGWSADQNNMYGMTTGSLETRGVGFYFSVRTGKDIFKSTASWKTNDANSLDESVNKNKSYTGQNYYQQVYGTFGLSKKLVHPLWIYAGLGVASNNELREFKDNNGKIEYVSNKDAKYITVNPEAGVRLKLGFLLLSYGANRPITPRFKETVVQHFSVAFAL